MKLLILTALLLMVIEQNKTSPTGKMLTSSAELASSATEKATPNIQGNRNISEFGSPSAVLHMLDLQGRGYVTGHVSIPEEDTTSIQERKNTAKEKLVPRDKSEKSSGKDKHSDTQHTEVESSNSIFLESRAIRTFFAMALPFTCEILMMILCYHIRDWDKFLRRRSVFLSLTLCMCSFTFSLFNYVYREYKTLDMLISVPLILYFAILYCYTWTSIAKSNAFLQRMLAHKVIVINEQQAHIQNVVMLAIEMLGGQAVMNLISYFFSCFNNFSFKWENSNGGFEMELNEPLVIPLSYFSNATLMILTCYVLLYVTTARTGNNEAERMLMGKMILFVNITHCFIFLCLLFLVVIRPDWVVWAVVHILFFCFGCGIFFITILTERKEISYKLLFKKESKKSAVVKIRYFMGKKEPEKIKVRSVDKMGPL